MALAGKSTNRHKVLNHEDRFSRDMLTDGLVIAVGPTLRIVGSPGSAPQWWHSGDVPILCQTPTQSIREATMPTSDPVQILQDIRTYLLEGFSQVTIAPLADAKTGSALINILQAKRRWAVEITDTFLDANSSLPHPLDAIRKWDLIGMLRSAESGSIVRVTTTGLRFI